ncbi:MAG: 16S rRNA (cytidine(1402)-2'-O)-methyltransferase [Thermoanaerobaculia bacterium]
MRRVSGSKGRLVIVGTPIGNLDDFSPRALAALRGANAIFCEDTRVTGKLAARFGLPAPRVSVPPPRESSRAAELLRRLEAGETVALVSDAGMPGLSDPGALLVEEAGRAGFPVEVVPGPSATAAALAVSGIPAVPHLFLGFLPSRAGERGRLLDTLRERPETLVWFEAPHRLVESLEDAARRLGPRRACVARELTKLHEETLRGELPELARAFRERGAARGEITVVVEGRTERPDRMSGEELDALILRSLGGGKPRRALAREIAAATGHPAREIYSRSLELEGTGKPGRGRRG